MNVQQYTLDQRVESAAKVDMKTMYCFLRRYFDLMAQVHSVIRTHNGCTFLRVWNGQVPLKPTNRELMTRLVRITPDQINEEIAPPLPEIAEAVDKLGVGALFDIDVYDDHIASVEQLKSGDFVTITNIHYYSQKSRSADCLTMHRRGEIFSRGIALIPLDFEDSIFQGFKAGIDKRVQEVTRTNEGRTAERGPVANQQSASRDGTSEEHPTTSRAMELIDIVSEGCDANLEIEEMEVEGAGGETSGPEAATNLTVPSSAGSSSAVASTDPVIEERGEQVKVNVELSVKVIVDQDSASAPTTVTDVNTEVIVEREDPNLGLEINTEDIPKHKTILIGNKLISVDRFVRRDECSYHFLTHAHSDHCGGLSASWTSPVYCSRRTANLLPILTKSGKRNGISAKHLKPLDVDKTYEFDGFSVTVLEANHCIGAVMFLFKGPAIPGGAVLCTGDFRADNVLLDMFNESESFKELAKTHLSKIFLDNTYLDDGPTHTFIDREEAVKMLLTEIRRFPTHKIILPLNKLGREDILELLHQRLGEDIELYDIRDAIATVEGLRMAADDRRKSLRSAITSPIKKPSRKICVVRRHANPIRKEIADGAPYVIFDITMMTQRLGLDEEESKNLIHIGYSDHSSRAEIFKFLSYLSFDEIVPISTSMSPFSLEELTALSKDIHFNKSFDFSKNQEMVVKKSKTKRVFSPDREAAEPTTGKRKSLEQNSNQANEEQHDKGIIEGEPVNKKSERPYQNVPELNSYRMISAILKKTNKKRKLRGLPHQSLSAARTQHAQSRTSLPEPNSMEEALAFLFAVDELEPIVLGGVDMNKFAPMPKLCSSIGADLASN